MGLLVAMLGNVFFFDDDGALQAKPVGGERAGDSIVPQALANLWEDRDLIEYGAQDGFVVLDAGVCYLLTLI